MFIIVAAVGMFIIVSCYDVYNKSGGGMFIIVAVMVIIIIVSCGDVYNTCSSDGGGVYNGNGGGDGVCVRGKKGNSCCNGLRWWVSLLFWWCWVCRSWYQRSF